MKKDDALKQVDQGVTELNAAPNAGGSERSKQFLEVMSWFDGCHMKWRIECKHSGAGYELKGSFDEALEAAQQECKSEWQRFVVWSLPANIRMAEVIHTGALWVKQKLTGEEVIQLMRRHKKKIAELSFIMGITQMRIRQVREHGLLDPNAVRDWLEAITSEDVGPLPEKYRIRRSEEADCN